MHKKHKHTVKTYVRPHVEFCIRAWSPYLQKDIKCLEKIQRRATKMVYGLKETAYDDRLKFLGLLSLENRRLEANINSRPLTVGTKPVHIYPSA